MRATKPSPWPITFAVLVGCQDDGPSSSSQAADVTSTEPGATGTSVGTTDASTAGTETGSTDAGTTDTTTGGDACPVKVWEGDFIGEPAGLVGYTEVTGFVRVRETSSKDFQGMECLERVSSFLEIRGNSALTSLSGLERLRQVGTLGVLDNPVLADIMGLSSLAIVESRLTINGNPALTSLRGLEALTDVGEDLEISENAALVDLGGLNAVSLVVGSLIIASNNNLVTCEGLTELVTVGGLNVWSNDNLQSLAGLESITELGPLRITANPAITDVTSLMSASVSETASIEIKDNAMLPQCAAEALADAVKPIDYMGMEDVSGNLGICP